MTVSSHTTLPDRLERSQLSVPASNYDMIRKAAASAADAVCIDLEDAVAPSEKEASRANVVKAFRELDFGHRLRVFPGHRWHYVMQRVVVAARAFDKRVIDGPFAGIKDAEGFKRACDIAQVMGFDGKWCIHPNQVETANRVFSPPEGQVAWAQAV